MLAPFTQSVTFGWRAELRFYEKRVEILRHLEEQGAMWSFRVSEELAEARLIDLYHQISIKQDRASLHLLAPSERAEETWNALAYAVEQISPRSPRWMALGLQFLEAIKLDFDEAVARGNEAVIAPINPEGVSTVDWAVLMDFSIEGAPEIFGQTEFGIVREDEVVERLARRAGRTNLADAPTIGASQWRELEFPGVALFADVTFRRDIREATEGLAELRSFWEGGVARASSLVAALKAKLVPDDTPKEVAS